MTLAMQSSASAQFKQCVTCADIALACVPAVSAAIVPPAVTRDRNNPMTLAMQSALVPAQGMFAKESTQSRTTIKGSGQEIEVSCCDLCTRSFCVQAKVPADSACFICFDPVKVPGGLQAALHHQQHDTFRHPPLTLHSCSLKFITQPACCAVLWCVVCRSRCLLTPTAVPL
jgi:hypothetical protein